MLLGPATHSISMELLRQKVPKGEVCGLSLMMVEVFLRGDGVSYGGGYGILLSVHIIIIQEMLLKIDYFNQICLSSIYQEYYLQANKKSGTFLQMEIKFYRLSRKKLSKFYRLSRKKLSTFTQTGMSYSTKSIQDIYNLL